MVSDPIYGLSYIPLFPFFKNFEIIPILTYVCLRIHNSEQEDRFKEDSLMMVMEVPDHPQNEISQRSTHLIQHIKKSAHLDENPKTESKNGIARSYIATPLCQKELYKHCYKHRGVIISSFMGSLC